METHTATQGTSLENDPTARRKSSADIAAPTSSAVEPRIGSSSGSSFRSQLITESGKTSIANEVVAKIAGLSAREIPGVHSMGTGASRRMGQLKSLVPGASVSAAQGVSVEVGEQETAVDLDIVTWYGQSIVDITQAVRRNVTDRIETMTGLKVVEVNINVDDIYVEGEQEEAKEPRVQ